MLSAKLESIRDDVYEGRGFAVLRGLDPAHFPIEDLTMIYMGISSYVGDMIGRQDKPGNCLGEFTQNQLDQQVCSADLNAKLFSSYRCR